MRKGGPGASPKENQSVITLEGNLVRFVKLVGGCRVVIASGDCAVEGSEEWPTRQRVGQGVLVQAMHQDVPRSRSLAVLRAAANR